MARAKIIKTNIITKGEFLGMKAPHYDIFDVELEEKDYQKINEKTQEVLSHAKSFNIVINASKVSSFYTNQLSSDLKSTFELNFAPFDYATKSYKYYTSSFVSEEDQKKKLQNIFDTLSDFEKNYLEKTAKNKPEFKKAVEEIQDFETPEFDVKYNKDLDTYVIISKIYLTSPIYGGLARASKEVGYINNSSSIQELFSDKKYKKNAYFIIDKVAFGTIESFLREKKEEEQNFTNKQSDIYEKNKELFDSLIYNEDNIFDFKVSLNEKKKCFEFFCKGYTMSSYENNVKNRNLLELWALNFILSDSLENLKNDISSPEYEIETPNNYKENLNERKDSSKANKTYFVPFEEIEKIQRISKKFHEENKIWSRPIFEIKKASPLFAKNNSYTNLEKYPAIFLDGNGKLYLTFAYRNVKSKKLDSNIIAMKSIEINQEEYNYLTKEHLFADNILKNTKSLNVQLWAGYEASIDPAQSESAFANVIMAHELYNMKKEEKKSAKKMKI